MIQLEDDFDFGTTIRDDVIPLALEYYLGVIDQGDSDDDDDDLPEDDDEDEEEKPKPKKKKADEAKPAAGGDQKECK